MRAPAHCAGNARLLAAPNRYLAAGSTTGSCLFERADDGLRPGRVEAELEGGRANRKDSSA